MQHVVIRRPGSYDRLECLPGEAVRAPEGHAVVRTASIGVNFADVVVRLGLYPTAKRLVGWPITPGFEFSGVIESLGGGHNPQGLRVGEEVVGVMLFGAYASEVAVPYSQLFRVPRGMSLLQAGAVPVASLTAYYALQVLGAASPGKTVLVHSAAGGVGSVMVQMARLLGCRVVGVVGSTKKVTFVQSLGADAVIDASREDVFARARELSPGGYHLVLDANGATSVRGSYKALRPTGRLVVYGAHTMLSRGSGRPNWLKMIWNFLRTPRFDPIDLINENKSVLGFNLSELIDQQELLRESFNRILAWYQEGALKLPQVQEFDLKDVALAHQTLQSGKTMGKLALVPMGAPQRALPPTEQSDEAHVEG